MSDEWEVSNDGEHWVDLVPGRDPRMFQFSRRRELRVGDVCKDPAQLRAGMRVRQVFMGEVREFALGRRGDIDTYLKDAWRAAAPTPDGSRYVLFDHHCRDEGVTILALPEEAPAEPVSEPYKLQFGCRAPGAIVPPPAITSAAPSLEEQVPVPSKWRTDMGIVILVTAVANGEVTYSHGEGSFTVPGWRFLARATRIDEPAGAVHIGAPFNAPTLTLTKGEITFSCAKLESHPDGSHTVTAHDGTVTECKDREALRAHIEANRTPPARCAPGCEPARPCRITIPVTDQGTRYECPAFREDRIKSGRVPLADGLAALERKFADKAEAQSWRSQKWEPNRNGFGGMVGGVWRRR